MPTLHEMYEAAEAFCERYIIDDEFTVDEVALASFFEDVSASDSPTLIHALGRWQQHIAAREIRHVLKYMTPIPSATFAVADALLRTKRTRMHTRRQIHGRRALDVRALSTWLTLRNALSSKIDTWYLLPSHKGFGWYTLHEEVKDAQRRDMEVMIPYGLSSVMFGQDDQP